MDKHTEISVFISEQRHNVCWTLEHTASSLMSRTSVNVPGRVNPCSSYVWVGLGDMLSKSLNKTFAFSLQFRPILVTGSTKPFALIRGVI